MILAFSPVFSLEPLSLAVDGDVLTINEQRLDFTALPEGGVLPRDAIGSDWIAGKVTRTSGHVIVPVVLPHTSDAPDARKFPVPMTIDEDGPVTLPLNGSANP
jgi:hypothetical protein